MIYSYITLDFSTRVYIKITLFKYIKKSMHGKLSTSIYMQFALLIDALRQLLLDVKLLNIQACKCSRSLLKDVSRM